MKIVTTDSVPPQKQFLLEDQGLSPSKTYEVPSHVGHMLINEGLAEYAPVGVKNVVEHEPKKSITLLDTVLDGHERFEEGETYAVSQSLANYFIEHGWARASDKSVRARDLAQPFDAREATDDFAEELERKVHLPARERSQVETVRVDEQGNRHSVGTRSGAEAVDLDVDSVEQTGEPGF